MSEEEGPAQALIRSEEKRRYVKGFCRFWIVWAALLAVNLVLFPGYLWVKWLALAGVVGYIVRGIKLFVLETPAGEALREAIREADRDRGR